MTMIIRTYSELSRLPTFEERFEYLKLNGRVGEQTFGFDRIFNQMFYKSEDWLAVRRYCIIRDFGCDLGIVDHEIPEGIKILVHHMNPISIRDIEERSDFLLNPKYLITTIHNTHQAITYGDVNILNRVPVERRPNDTCPWRH